MKYWTNLFTPETYEAFGQSDRSISGFRESQRAMAEKVAVGDLLLCYMVRMSRWVGVFEVLDGPFIDDSPIFVPENDPFVVRFRVKPHVWLPLEQTVPIRDSRVFSQLTFTREVESGGYWLGPLRRSLCTVNAEDGDFVNAFLNQQARERLVYEVDEGQYRKALRKRIQRSEGAVTVSVPDDEDDLEQEGKVKTASSDRQSIRIQADLCRIGEAMGFKIWLPANDRSRVTEHWQPQERVLLERLPLNYDETTLDTIERIDVLWLQGRTIQRAFEVEHTTAIYSGLLRMADLCALLPNINVKLHIVAPAIRREKVFQEITRPVFSLLDHSPLSGRCTYLSYESIEDLGQLDYLKHTTDSVLEDFAEEAE